MRRARSGILYCVLLLTAGCGGSPAATPPTVTVTTVISPSMSGSVGPPTTLPSVSPPSVTVGTPAPRPPSGSARVGVVPNVVGVNHQLAQDTMQAAGFYFLTEEDATGQGRLLVIDRNWVVVSQVPAGGTTAPLETKILLRSKKVGE